MYEEVPPRLHVPEPALRPGDQPDFSDIKVPRAGEVRRPDPGDNPESMRDLAFSI
ncbi:MAG: 3-methyl-2-oxobutanoate dehydrogenase (2-methylpropanoyl-transferring) subunit alpha, partial [Hoeflea sp.]|nr:3-methyl-2-oxobutanoate dehydrogenase (2-methylpropanoyl-transferring) subunit alpha [Hoeflea sp.]